MASALSGILNLDKPRGISSAGALTRIKYLFPRDERPKIGHAGTLDPFATGVLLVLVGQATRMCEGLMGQEKRYLATIKFGATTPTLDPTSPEVSTGEDLRFEISDLRAVLPRFTGTIQQVPPAFSALKREGKPLYKLAREGKEIELEPRPVAVHSIDLVKAELPFIQLDIRCGRGTYIRSLARDIAEALGTKGYLTELCRTAVGEYSLETAIPLAELTPERLASRLRGAAL